MKLIEKKIAPSNKSFSIYRNRTPCLDESWHYHEEYELIFVIKGTGMRFIGDDVQEFKGGELALIGPNLPHLWRNSPEYYNNLGLETDVLVIQFAHSFLGEKFFDVREMTLIKSMLTHSNRGLAFHETRLKKEMKNLITELIEQTAFDSIQTLLSILHKLASTNVRREIASSGYMIKSSDKDSKRINTIYQFVLDNFHREISLSEVANIANLGNSPFCRFFKTRTHRSFLEFLNEVRIGHACKLLIEDVDSIGQIAFKSGYNSQTNFNRQFKKIKKRSPAEFRKMYLNRSSN